MAVQKITRWYNEQGNPTTSVLLYGFRSSFMHVFKPTYNSLKKADEYCVDILIPKNIDMSAMEAVVADIMHEQWGDTPPIFENPKEAHRWGNSRYLKDGDKKKTREGTPYDGYPGHVYFTAKSSQDQPPRVVDMAKRDITNPNDFQSGMFANYNVEFYVYDTPGNAGIGFQLRSIMKTGEGEPFRGGMSGEAAVAVFDVDPEMMI